MYSMTALKSVGGGKKKLAELKNRVWTEIVRLKTKKNYM